MRRQRGATGARGRGAAAAGRRGSVSDEDAARRGRASPSTFAMSSWRKPSEVVTSRFVAGFGR